MPAGASHRSTRASSLVAGGDHVRTRALNQQRDKALPQNMRALLALLCGTLVARAQAQCGSSTFMRLSTQVNHVCCPPSQTGGRRRLQGKVQSRLENVYIGANGRGKSAAMYNFAKVQVTSKQGSFSDLMLKSCKKIGMKPVCDFAAYCERDYRSLYLGQTGHLSSKRARSKNDPHGYYEMRGKVNGLCFYTSFANGNKALCNIPTNSHRWKAPSSSSDIFLCGKEVMKSFKVQLGGKNGVRAKGYELKVVKLTSIAGSYSNLMIKMCKKFDMKPIW